jgi:hypothetical protein
MQFQCRSFLTHSSLCSEQQLKPLLFKALCGIGRSTRSQAAAMAANGVANGVDHKRQKLEPTLHDSHNVVLVLDYGSQYTQLICRRIREIGVFSMMFPGDASMVSSTPEPQQSAYRGFSWRTLHLHRCKYL